MRILLLTPMPPDPEAPGAIPPLLYAALTGLRAGNEVTVVCVAGPDPREISAVERLRAEGVDVHAAVREPGGSPLTRARRAAWFARGWLRHRRPWRTVWFSDPGVQPILDRLLATGRYDVVAAEDDAVAIYDFGPDVARVLTEHEVDRVPAPGAGRLARRDHARWPAFQARVAPRFDIVQVFTEGDAQTLAAIAPSVAGRIRVVPFGITMPPAPDLALEQPETVLFAGNYTHPPNVDAALWLGREVVPALRALRPGVRVLIAGIHAPPEVTALAGDGIEVLGAVPDLGEEMQRAAVILAPVRSGGGMRMKVLHALAAGKAVVTTPLGARGLSDVSAPPLAVASDAQGIAAAAAELLADAPRRHRLGQSARAYAEQRYGPDAYAARLEAVYAEAVALRAAGEGAR
jgi:glycosyltransferase involved in cell wall biosynthesis